MRLGEQYGGGRFRCCQCCLMLNWIAKLKTKTNLQIAQQLFTESGEDILHFTAHKALWIVTIIESTLLGNIGSTLLDNIESSLLHRLRQVSRVYKSNSSPALPRTRNVENHLLYMNTSTWFRQLRGFDWSFTVLQCSTARHKAV